MVTILGVSKTFAFGPYGEYRTFEKTETSDKTKVGHSTTSTTRAERASQCGLRSLNDSCSFSSLALLSCIYWRRKKISPIAYRTQKIYVNKFRKYVTPNKDWRTMPNACQAYFAACLTSWDKNDAL